VNYAIRFSGPVTALTARRVRYSVGPDLICQPGPSSGIKTHSSPAAFPTTLSLPFLSPLSCSCTGPHRVSGSLVPPNRHEVASERNASAGPLALIRLTPRQRCLVGRPTVRRPLAVTLMKRLAFRQGAGDLVTRRPEM